MNKEHTTRVKHILFAQFTIILFLIAGCGNGDSQNSEGNTTGQSIKLAGNSWMPQQCEIDDDATAYHKLIYEFDSDGRVKQGRQNYEDSDCMIKNERFLPVDIEWRYTESGTVMLEDGTQGEAVSIDKSGEVVNGYYTITGSNLLCFSYSLAFLQSETDERGSDAIDYDHCLILEEVNQPEEDDTMINQEELIRNYLKEAGWDMEITGVRLTNNIDIPNCSFYYAQDTTVLDEISSTIGITSNGQIIGIHDPEVVIKVLSVIPGVNSVSAENWAELLSSFSPDIAVGWILLELRPPYIEKFEKAGVEFVPPEVKVNDRDSFTLHFFLEKYEPAVVHEVNFEIENGRIQRAESQFVAAFTD
jgi:hypothetical protein